MRDIKHIVIHCTATAQTATITSIQKYWRERLGWRNPGYHIVVNPNGTYVRIAKDTQVCNGVAGYNAGAIHISYIGGIDVTGKSIDNRTEEQKSTLLGLIRAMKKIYPQALVLGHKDFPGVMKDCPSFDARKEYSDI